MFAILFYAGMIEVTGIGIKKLGFSFVLWLILWFWGTGLAVGWSEELIFRGYLLQNLKEGIGLVWAVVLSCVFYGAVHMANPNSSLLSGILIAILGYVRIFGWLRTGQLWLSMGMHASWNFFQGPVFGFHVSGMKVHNLISHQATGPDWITGGVFGPEAGIVVLPAILLGLLGMYFYSTARKNTPLLEWKIRAAQ
jgi:membrane protease YdiL (CAAX protease family)